MCAKIIKYNYHVRMHIVHDNDWPREDNVMSSAFTNHLIRESSLIYSL